MRIARCHALAWTLLTALTLFAATDKLKNAMQDLGSDDPAAARKAEQYLNKQRSAARPFLTEILVNCQQNGLARFRAARLLGDFGDQTAVPALKQALLCRDETDATVRAEVIRSLVRLGSTDSLIEYFKLGTEKAPIVNAAIAIGLRGRDDDEAKKTLGALMANPDPRVAEAAMSAVCWTYQSISKQDPHCPTSLGDTTPKNTPPKTDKQLMMAHPNVASGKTPPSPGDQAILDALKAKQTSDDPRVREHAASLLNTLSEHYKQE